jgi:hypothetical protein
MKRLVGTGISETELACNDQLSSYAQVKLAKPEPAPTLSLTRARNLIQALTRTRTGHRK